MSREMGYEFLFGGGKVFDVRPENLGRVRRGLMLATVEHEVLLFVLRRAAGDKKRTVSIKAPEGMTKEEREEILPLYLIHSDPWPFATWVWVPAESAFYLMLGMEHEDGLVRSFQFWASLQQNDGLVPLHDGDGYFKLLKTTRLADSQQCQNAGISYAGSLAGRFGGSPVFCYRIPVRP